MATSRNKTVTGIVIPKEIKEQLEQMAKRDRRSLSNYIAIVLEDHVKHNENKEQNSEEENNYEKF